MNNKCEILKGKRKLVVLKNNITSSANTYSVRACVHVRVSIQQQEPCLLPEVTAQDQGKICVVIDLDETLVHSSFKVMQ